MTIVSIYRTCKFAMSPNALRFPGAWQKILVLNQVLFAPILLNISSHFGTPYWTTLSTSNMTSQH